MTESSNTPDVSFERIADTVRALMQKNRNNKRKIRKLLIEFNADYVKDLKPSQYLPFYLKLLQI